MHDVKYIPLVGSAFSIKRKTVNVTADKYIFQEHMHLCSRSLC